MKTEINEVMTEDESYRNLFESESKDNIAMEKRDSVDRLNKSVSAREGIYKQTHE